MKRLKDTEIKYNLKITIIQEHLKDKICESRRPYKILVEIKKKIGWMSSCFNYNQKGKREAMKFIKRECNLK